MRALPANWKGFEQSLAQARFPFSPTDFRMHVDDIPAALASQDAATIKEALAALASFPPWLAAMPAAALFRHPATPSDVFLRTQHVCCSIVTEPRP
jgi:hypothetical protein